jgi:hypothetical protein
MGGTTEMTDGTIVTEPPDCQLWQRRLPMIEELDALLVLDRGGWQTGTRVRTHGVPPAITVLGRLAAETGAVSRSQDMALTCTSVDDMGRFRGWIFVRIEGSRVPLNSTRTG